MSTVKSERFDDEIDFFELAEKLWKLRIIIILCMLVGALSGGLYILLVPSVYNGSVYLSPPNEEEIFELNRFDFILNDGVDKVDENSIIKSVDSEYVFSKFLSFSNSNELQRKFFRRDDVYNYFIESNKNESDAWLAFEKSIKVYGSNQKVNIVFQTGDANLSAKWAGEFAELTIDYTRERLISSLNAEIKLRYEMVSYEASIRLQNYLGLLEMELIRLKEALDVAKTIGLVQPLETGVFIIGNKQNENIISDLRSLYEQGSNSLETEISVLSSRGESEKFVVGLLELRLRQKQLLSIEIDSSKIIPALIVYPAISDDRPVKPKKFLVLLFSSLSGLLLGIMVALVLDIFKSRNFFNSFSVK
ncbi:Wzz/FepE/Etk N-terminal domain-containing protein [Aliamphritea ceti]|uniref:Wzz/FepE/Etk N-terminal domain-containing protein n=1 Tax=Aliamphritea ceti TaxID=1524258 RepID=UPI0021C41484|nr:Wzz/FepE/Etk N-terminal domain-containing protein [Aliamphritea ceti]